MKKENFLFLGTSILFLIFTIVGLNQAGSKYYSAVIFFLFFIPVEILFFWFLRKNYELNKKNYLFLVLKGGLLGFFWLIVALVISKEEDGNGLILFPVVLIPNIIFWFWMYKLKEEKQLKISISSPDKEFKSILKNLDEYNQKNISDLLKMSESEHLEFKSTLKYDIRENRANPLLAMEIIKTIAGFLNNKGGILIIGYDDDNDVIYGIEKDYPVTSKRNNFDGWQQYLISQVNDKISREINHYLSIEAIPYGGKTLAKVSIKKSSKPIFVKYGEKGGDFFVRIHGQTENLSPKDTNNWINEHFGSK